jgi:glycosyltransferase involved in cell wall biosynthesis
MSFTLNLPVNSVSFGQVSTLLLRELYKKNLNDFTLYPIGDRYDLSTQESDEGFFNFIQSRTADFLSKIKRIDPLFKLWHINGSLDSPSDKRYLLSFYELDNPTKEEINIVKNQDKVFFSSNYTVDTFKMFGCSNVEFLPLAFDKYNFKRLEKKYFSDERIVFNLVGKLEKRKNHKKVIQAWVKKFGNNPKYHLQCSIYNPFLKEEDNKNLMASILEGVNYFNISFMGHMPKNSMYNDYLNSADIIIGMSGGEGWGLPEFHSVAMGKHAIILDAHSYKDWANEANSVLVKPSSKIDAVDNMFFHKGQSFNQGNIFIFNDDEFIAGCEKAIQRVQSNKLNSEGLKLQSEFTSEKFADNVLNIINS